jgi:glycosyltransferase 2 family protein
VRGPHESEAMRSTASGTAKTIPLRHRRAWMAALRRRALGWLTPALMLATGGALVLAIDPTSFAAALARFRLWVLPLAIAAALAMYVLQGVRWHQLLRAVGARMRMRDSVLLNAAGQAITAILPLGDLTRAVFASEASGAAFGRVAATVTVQELAYTLLLVLSSVPVLLALGLGMGVVLVVVGGVAGVLAILTVPRVYGTVRRLVAQVPLLRRLLVQIDVLQEATADLLRRPDTLRWTVVDAGRVALVVTLLWLIVNGLEPGALSWWEAAFVLALSYVGGAVSLVPGGAGANEAGVVALLMLVHVDPTTAAAAAIVQRLLTTGLATLVGWSAYLVARRRFAIGSPFAVRTTAPAPDEAPALQPAA